MSFENFDIPGIKPVRVVAKDWGWEWIYVDEPEYCMKALLVVAGHRGSLHRHLIKTETFVVLQGTVKIEWTAPWEFSANEPKPKSWDRHTRNRRFKPEDKLRLQAGSWHRFTAEENTVILEVSTHDWPEDVERLEKGGEVPKL